MSKISNMGISFQLRTGFDLPLRGEPVKRRTHDPPRSESDESKWEPSPRPLLPRTRNRPIRRSHVEYATANGRANRWDVWFVPGHCSSCSSWELWWPGFYPYEI